MITQLPDRFEFLEAIPRTSTGKFWKVKLRERFAVPAIPARAASHGRSS